MGIYMLTVFYNGFPGWMLMAWGLWEMRKLKNDPASAPYHPALYFFPGLLIVYMSLFLPMSSLIKGGLPGWLLIFWGFPILKRYKKDPASTKYPPALFFIAGAALVIIGIFFYNPPPTA